MDNFSGADVRMPLDHFGLAFFMQLHRKLQCHFIVTFLQQREQVAAFIFLHCMNLRSKVQSWTLFIAFEAIFVYLALQDRVRLVGLRLMIQQNDSVSMTPPTFSPRLALLAPCDLSNVPV